MKNTFLEWAKKKKLIKDYKKRVLDKSNEVRLKIVADRSSNISPFGFS
jgi:DNA-directed RNA polymerase subunit E'/Rpb7